MSKMLGDLLPPRQSSSKEYEGQYVRLEGNENYDHLRGVEQLERVAGERGLRKQASGIALTKSN
jgi:hypothetical protein